MLSFIFEEPAPEQFRHNDNSRMLLNENYAAWVHFRLVSAKLLFVGRKLTKYQV